jgi:hypothetical protein
VADSFRNSERALVKKRYQLTGTTAGRGKDRAQISARKKVPNPNMMNATAAVGIHPPKTACRVRALQNPNCSFNQSF